LIVGYINGAKFYKKKSGAINLIINVDVVASNWDKWEIVGVKIVVVTNYCFHTIGLIV